MSLVVALFGAGRSTARRTRLWPPRSLRRWRAGVAALAPATPLTNSTPLRAGAAVSASPVVRSSRGRRAAEATLTSDTLYPDPARYEELLEAKKRHVEELLGARLQAPLEVVASPPLHHRMKASFEILHQGEDLLFGLRMPGTRELVVVEQQPILCERLCRLTVDLRAALRADTVGEARFRAFEVEMLANSDGDALVCLMYHRPLGESYAATAAALAERLGANVVGRSRGRRVVAGAGRLVQHYEVEGRVYPQFHRELMFSQSNAHTCREMLRWTSAQAAHIEGAGARDLLELYCGNGNFTLPLARHFRRVFSTETVRDSLKYAEECAGLAGVSNVTFARLSAAETAEALRRDRRFRRLDDAGVELDNLDLGVVLVDPPRCGLCPASRELVRGFEHCLYVSCNPVRLAEDLAAMPEFDIEAAALFDQFPFTKHIEVAVRLARRGPH